MDNAQKTVGPKTEPLTLKNIAVLLSLLALVASLQSAFIVPTILAKSREIMDVQIDRHNEHPHPEMLTKEDLRLALQGIYAQLDSINRRLDQR